MKRKGTRNLTPAEQELWNEVKRRTTPLHPEQRKPVEEPAPPKQISTPRVQKPKTKLPIFEVGQNAIAKASVEKKPAQQPVAMDQKAFGQLKRGKLKPESRIDLHGMTVARAHGVLTTFIQDSHARGLRLVLVITGKGKDKDDGGPIPTPKGILRRQVPMWLAAPPLSAMILQTSEAHIRHGGSGALYVYLRRRR